MDFIDTSVCQDEMKKVKHWQPPFHLYSVQVTTDVNIVIRQRVPKVVTIKQGTTIRLVKGTKNTVLYIAKDKSYQIRADLEDVVEDVNRQLKAYRFRLDGPEYLDAIEEMTS